MHNMCVGNSVLAAWEVASCAQTAGGSRVTGRSKISVICNVHSGARSREGVAHRPLHSIPRSQKIARWSDISMYPCFSYMVRAPRPANRCSSWAGPGTIWNSHAASNTGTVRTLANLFSLMRELIEVILLQPRQAWRWIPLGNRESRCDATCSGTVLNVRHLVRMAVKA